MIPLSRSYLYDKSTTSATHVARAQVWVGQVSARLDSFGWDDLYTDDGPADLELYLALHDLIRIGAITGPNPYGAGTWVEKPRWRRVP